MASGTLGRPLCARRGRSVLRLVAGRGLRDRAAGGVGRAVSRRLFRWVDPEGKPGQVRGVVDAPGLECSGWKAVALQAVFSRCQAAAARPERASFALPGARTPAPLAARPGPGTVLKPSPAAAATPSRRGRTGEWTPAAGQLNGNQMPHAVVLREGRAPGAARGEPGADRSASNPRQATWRCTLSVVTSQRPSFDSALDRRVRDPQTRGDPPS
jgi:hypothetical protein